MQAETYASAIAANAVLERLVSRLIANKLLSVQELTDIALGAAQQLNATREPVFEEAAKAVLALYSPRHP
jgi:hypothetical protein